MIDKVEKIEMKVPVFLLNGVLIKWYPMSPLSPFHITEPVPREEKPQEIPG